MGRFHLIDIYYFYLELNWKQILNPRDIYQVLPTFKWLNWIKIGYFHMQQKRFRTEAF